jgi:hypothetical protein
VLQDLRDTLEMGIVVTRQAWWKYVSIITTDRVAAYSYRRQQKHQHRYHDHDFRLHIFLIFVIILI